MCTSSQAAILHCAPSPLLAHRACTRPSAADRLPSRAHNPLLSRLSQLASCATATIGAAQAVARPSRKMIQARAQPAGRLRAPKGGRGRVNSPFTASRFPALGLARERSLRTPLALAGTHSDGLQVGAASGASLPLLGVVQGVWPPFQPSPHLHTHHRHSPPPPLPTPPFARSCPRIARLDPSADGARIPARLAGAAPPMTPPPAPRPPSAAPPSARSVGRRGRRMHARPSPRAGVAASPPARLLPRGKGVFARAFRVPQASVGPVRWRWRASARMSCIVTGTCET